MDLTLIPIPLLFAVSVVGAVLANTLKAYFVKKERPEASDVYFLNAGLSAFSMIILLALSGFKLTISSFTIILSLVFGLLIMVNGVTQAQALKIGPYSYTTTIVSLSTIVTALSGWVFWGEQLSVFKVIGLVFIVACFFLAVDKSKDQNAASAKWFLLCMFCLITSAGIGLTQKIHQKSDFKLEINGFLVVSFLISTIFSFTMAFISKRKEIKLIGARGKEGAINVKLLVLTCTVCGLFTALNHFINLYLSGAVDSAVMFPIVNGVPFVSAVLISFLLFKEKLSKKQTFGIGFGILSMLCLCL